MRAVPSPSFSALLRRKARSLRFWVRAWLGMGALPNALIIGAAKAGTTSLFDWLSQHPEIAPSRIKEVKYFDHNYSRGINWYRAQFAPQRHHKIILEASPSYLWNAPVPERVRGVLGAPKLIVLLRNPVDRAYSHYAMKVRQDLESLPFEEALDGERKRLDPVRARAARGDRAFLGAYERFAYFAESLYAEQLERWLAVFPRETFLFIRAEDLFGDPRAVLARTLEFLDLAPFDFPDVAPRNVGSYAPLSPEERDRLERRFAEPNRRLAQMTGISWP